MQLASQRAHRIRVVCARAVAPGPSVVLPLSATKKIHLGQEYRTIKIVQSSHVTRIVAQALLAIGVIAQSCHDGAAIMTQRLELHRKRRFRRNSPTAAAINLVVADVRLSKAA